MRIVFLHGRMSSPNSRKCEFLRKNGHEVFAPKLISHNWEQSVTAAREMLEEVKPDLVIGSSRGGAVAMATNTTIPMILICPAWGKYAPWGAESLNPLLHASLHPRLPESLNPTQKQTSCWGHPTDVNQNFLPV